MSPKKSHVQLKKKKKKKEATCPLLRKAQKGEEGGWGGM